VENCMTTLNVQELFEKFMQDPEYIGKEELALAEAQQRVIQHMNNTKALSMAKMDSPVDNLLNFLLQKSDDDLIQRSRNSPQYSHVVSHEVNEPTHEEILQHFKDELIAMAHPDVQGAEDPWQAIVDDPNAAFADSPNLTHHHNFLGETSKGVGGIANEPTPDNPDAFRRNIPTGMSGIRELAQRANIPEVQNLVEEFENAVGDFNANQVKYRETYTATEDKEPQGKTVNRLPTGMFAPREHEGTGEKFVEHSPDEGETQYDRKPWEAAFNSAIDSSANWDSNLHQGWGHERVQQGTNAGASKLSIDDHAIAGEQGRVVGLVQTLTGKTHTSPQEALERLKNIRDNPEQFMRQHPETGRDIMRTVHSSGGVKHFVENTMDDMDSTDYDSYAENRDGNLGDIVSLVGNMERERDGFNHPPEMKDDTGRGWKHEQPLSPLQQHQIHNAQHPTLSSDVPTGDSVSPAGRDLMNKVQQQYNRGEHGTPEALTGLFNKVIGENAFSFPPTPADVNEREAKWPKGEYPVKDMTTDEAHDFRFPEESDKGEAREQRIGEMLDGTYNRIPLKADRKEGEGTTLTPDDILDRVMDGRMSNEEAQSRWRFMSPDEQEMFTASTMAYFRSQGLDEATENLAGMSAQSDTARLSDEGEGFDTSGETEEEKLEREEEEVQDASGLTRLVRPNPDWKDGDSPHDRFRFVSQKDVDEEAKKGSYGQYLPSDPPPVGESTRTDDTVHHTPTRPSYGGGSAMAQDQGATMAQTREPGNVPLGVSEGGSAYDGEHNVVLHHRDEQGNYREHRDWMKELVDYGIPIEDLTNENSQGDLVWSKESMLEGMRQHGMLHHGQDDQNRRWATKEGGRVGNQGVAPVFPDKGPRTAKARLNALKNGMTPEQKTRAAGKESLLKRMWNDLQQGKGGKKGAKNESPYNRTAGDREEFGQATARSTKGVIQPGPSEFESGSPQYVRDIKTGEDVRVEASLSTKPTFKRTGGALGSFSDGKYLNNLIRDAVSKEPKRGIPGDEAKVKAERENAMREAFDQHFEGQKNLDYGDVAHYFADSLGIQVPHPKTFLWERIYLQIRMKKISSINMIYIKMFLAMIRKRMYRWNNVLLRI